MSACFKWREQLLDLALGLPASPELEAHLPGCVACATALTEWRARAEQLDSSIRHLAASEPSSYLGSGVLARINSAPARVAWAEQWRVALVVLATVMGITVMVYVVRGAIQRRDRAEKVSSIAAALSNWRSPTEALLGSPADPLLRTLPRLGEPLSEIKPTAGQSKIEKGEKNAN